MWAVGPNRANRYLGCFSELSFHSFSIAPCPGPDLARYFLQKFLIHRDAAQAAADLPPAPGRSGATDPPPALGRR